jgi:hypothetical protein
MVRVSFMVRAMGIFRVMVLVIFMVRIRGKVMGMGRVMDRFRCMVMVNVIEW